MKRFSIQTLLLTVTLIGVSLGWLAERLREPNVYYLHVYSNRYHPPHDSRHPEHASEESVVNTCLLTIGITSDTPFHAYVSNNYSPTILLDGRFEKRGSLFTGRASVFIEDVGTAFECNDITNLPIDKLVPFWDDSHHIAISTQQDPYALEWDVGSL
ncbi:hypothetical protein [Crateriforma conspicua]|uniref:hypothetical protein n=1 Tax=Crateriforma conspicua TaxID=2527996 RepID=UPI00118C8005|nr:hypothetical protein [Crateriforma conspicua]QDV61098.1 hypothetical protein Mal65_02210 [Crateriforma conspicua]